MTGIGKYENIFSFAISTIENEKHIEDFIKTLKRNRVHYYRVDDKLFIANVNLKQCKHWFRPEAFRQKYFIFGKINSETHEIEYFYYEWEKGSFNEVTKKVDIPFFEEALINISSSLEEDYGWKTEYRDYLFEIVNCDRTIPNLWRYACSHLLTGEQEFRRLENLGIVYN